MLDSRVIASGIQSGRSLAKQAPPIQEMLGMKMQQNQTIMEVMKELLKTHMSDMESLRKGQWDLWYKAREKAGDSTLDQETKKYYEDLATEIEKKDFSRWGGLKGTLMGFGGEDATGGEGAGGADLATKFGLGGGGGADFLASKPETVAPTQSTSQRMGSNLRGIGQFLADHRGQNIAGQGWASKDFMQGLRKPSMTTGGGRVTVVSPDGKTGSIPANQLQQALTAGYKQVK